MQVGESTEPNTTLSTDALERNALVDTATLSSSCGMASSSSREPHVSSVYPPYTNIQRCESQSARRVGYYSNGTANGLSTLEPHNHPSKNRVFRAVSRLRFLVPSTSPLGREALERGAKNRAISIARSHCSRPSVTSEVRDVSFLVFGIPDGPNCPHDFFPTPVGCPFRICAICALQQ